VTDQRRTLGQLLAGALAIAILVIVAYFGFNQIPHATRPTLHPSTSATSTK